MADNVPITAGSGTNVATDDVSGVHYQKVKLVNGTADDATAIPGGANGLYVQGPAADDAVAAGNPVFIGGVANTSQSNRNPGDVVPLRMDLHGCAYVQIHEPIPAGTNNIGDVDVLSLPALPAGNNNIGDVDVASLPALPAGDNNIGNVDVVTLPALPAGSNNIGDVDVLTLPSLPAGTNNIGDVDVLTLPGAAHDAAVSGNPVRVGAKSLAQGTAVTAVSADGDTVDLIADRGGRQYVECAHPNAWRVGGQYTSAQTNTSLRAAPGAGLSLYITDIMVSCGATAGTVRLLDGSGGTILVELYPAANGGMVSNLRTPIKLTANTALCYTTVTATTTAVTVCGHTAA